MYCFDFMDTRDDMGEKSYIIAAGGSDEVGLWGYMESFNELMHQGILVISICLLIIKPCYLYRDDTGEKSYIIAAGGSDEVGLWGYLESINFSYPS